MVLWPGMVMPRRRRRAEQLVAQQGDVGDGRAGVGVDQLDDRVVVGARPDAGEPLVGGRGRTVQRAHGCRAGAQREEAGRQLVGAFDDQRVGTGDVRCRSGADVDRARGARRRARSSGPDRPLAVEMVASGDPGRAEGQTTSELVSLVSAGGCSVSCTGAGCTSASTPTVTSGDDDGQDAWSTSRRGVRRRRTTSGIRTRLPGLMTRPSVVPARWAGRARAPRAAASPWTTSSTSRGTEAGPSTARGSTGTPTCQARVERLSALACTRPSVASSPAATSPSAGEGSTM